MADRNGKIFIIAQDVQKGWKSFLDSFCNFFFKLWYNLQPINENENRISLVQNACLSGLQHRMVDVAQQVIGCKNNKELQQAEKEVNKIFEDITRIRRIVPGMDRVNPQLEDISINLNVINVLFKSAEEAFEKKQKIDIETEMKLVFEATQEFGRQLPSEEIDISALPVR